jgi:SAM-dependent methyltransferase
VTALDIAPSRVAYAQELARSRDREQRQGALPETLNVVEGDFFDPELVLETFDIVAYWDSFGIGSDRDQRRLLNRIRQEWLSPGGRVLLDVFNPLSWQRGAGQQKRVVTDTQGTFLQTRDFDAIGCRFVESWQAEGSPGNAGNILKETQSIRCYSPTDFLLLLEGTQLVVEHAEANDTPFDMKAISSTGTSTISESKFQDAWSYYLVLKADTVTA